MWCVCVCVCGGGVRILFPLTLCTASTLLFCFGGPQKMRNHTIVVFCVWCILVACTERHTHSAKFATCTHSTHAHTCAHIHTRAHTTQYTHTQHRSRRDHETQDTYTHAHWPTKRGVRTLRQTQTHTSAQHTHTHSFTDSSHFVGDETWSFIRRRSSRWFSVVEGVCGVRVCVRARLCACVCA